MDVELPAYIDEGTLRDQDNVPLARFLKRYDRAQPTGRGQPFFSGREPEINAFRSAASGILQGDQANSTVIVEGPPGAGKSALLAQFQEEMLALPPVGDSGRRWLSVFMDGSEADSPAEIMGAIDDAIALQLAQEALNAKGQDGERASRSLLDWMNEITGGATRPKAEGALATAKRIIDDRGGGLMGFRIGAERDSSNLSMRGVASRRRSLWRGWQIILLIDEAQRISKAGNALSMLHQNTTRVPVTFCAFGLPGTAQALSKVGVSRATVAYDRRLGSLDGPAARMAVRRCFGQYGVTHSEQWEAAILARSANWPQHLASYLNAALTALRQGAQATNSLGDARRASLPKAMEAGDANRAAYYERRMEHLEHDSPWHSNYAKALLGWVEREKDNASQIDQSEILEFLQGPSLNLSQEQILRFMVSARHSGLIERAPNNRVSFPIPSFRGYLLEESLPPVPQAPAEAGREGDGND